ncbi:BRO-N domain-containing protein [Nocardia terpenica]|uniref:Bro-N domain-containing protein n=1 Tax=Nocardia terpenica TaxID=455432 RepID=A0A6G9Z753_9NOCA|nr:Bro-N domain-containing protein [Nocardia terpenica]QIS21280.1 hypothetical protein F6W96_26085 [Nocardia terpenica]
MSDIELHRSEFPLTGHTVRCVLLGDQILFAGTDACRVLGISNAPAAYARLDDSEKLILTSDDISSISASDSWMPNAGRLTMLTEAGLYTLIMRSSKPTARPFQAWVTSDLLPAIRTGQIDSAAQTAQMRQTLGQAIGEQLDIVAMVKSSRKVDIRRMSDGTVHCDHGAMDKLTSKNQLDENGDLFTYYRCPEQTGHDQRGRVLTVCGTWSPVKAHKSVKPAQMEVLDPPEPISTGTLFLDTAAGRVYGQPAQLAALVKALS